MAIKSAWCHLHWSAHDTKPRLLAILVNAAIHVDFPIHITATVEEMRVTMRRPPASIHTDPQFLQARLFRSRYFQVFASVDLCGAAFTPLFGSLLH